MVPWSAAMFHIVVSDFLDSLNMINRNKFCAGSAKPTDRSHSVDFGKRRGHPPKTFHFSEGGGGCSPLSISQTRDG